MAKFCMTLGNEFLGIPDKEKQVEVAKIVAELPAHDARDIVQYAKKYPKEPLDSFRKRVVEGKDKVEKVHLSIIPLREEIYSYLKTESQRKNISPEKLILLIVEGWMKTNNRETIK